jgi:hypothetical protein
MCLLLLMYCVCIAVSLDRTLRLMRSVGVARRKRTGLLRELYVLRLYC